MKIITAVTGTVAMLFMACGPAWAQVGQVTHLSGTLVARQADGKEKLLSVKSQVREGDVLSTQEDTYARIKFVDNGEIVLRPNSQLKVESYQYDETRPERDNVFVGLLKGGLRAVTGLIGKRSKEKVSYNTPTATIGIRGTHFGALFCQGDCGGVPTTTGQPPADGLHLDVAAGVISVTNPAGSQEFNAGQFGYVPNANTPPQIVPPQQGIQVTMPSSIAANKGSGTGIGKSNASECVAQ